MTKVVISLTTIPSRAKYLRFLYSSLKEQSVTPDRVEINIPYQYKRRDFGKVNLDDIPSEMNVFECEDFGPATKILPTLDRYRDQDALIVYCDDDRRYEKNWLKRLISGANNDPQSAICEEAFSIRYFERKLNSRNKIKYRIKQAITFGIYRRLMKNMPPYICEGFGGVLVRPNMIKKPLLPIPDKLYFVDDVYLSGLIYMNGYKIRKTQMTVEERSLGIEHQDVDIGEFDDALKHLVVDGNDRHDLNWSAIQYMREKFGIFC